jgi:uncharacterized membrane protein (DUF4010 family)
MDLLFLRPLAIALGLGLLVGLQREWAEREVAGIRTFGLITLLGCGAGLLSPILTPWVVPAGLLGVAALVAVGGVARMRAGETDSGITTEVATLLMYLVGAVVGLGFEAPGVVLGATVALLLHWKAPLHALVRSLNEGDLRAIFQFVLVALVVLPVLPDEAFGPYGVLNPFRIWLMVVLVVGISIGSYVGHRLLGERGGVLLAGLLGGMISSTATTVSYARQVGARPAISSSAAVVVVLASVVMFVRVLGEVVVVAPEDAGGMAPPLVIMALGMMVGAGVLARPSRRGGERGELASPEPPSELRTAMAFGFLYAIVLVSVAAAREHLGAGGLYAVAAISGLTDMDAITLSTSQLVRAGRLDAAVGWRVILVGGMANLVFKWGVLAALGGRSLLRRVGAVFGGALLLGVGLLAFWPS